MSARPITAISAPRFHGDRSRGQSGEPHRECGQDARPTDRRQCGSGCGARRRRVARSPPAARSCHTAGAVCPGLNNRLHRAAGARYPSALHWRCRGRSGTNRGVRPAWKVSDRSQRLPLHSWERTSSCRTRPPGWSSPENFGTRLWTPARSHDLTVAHGVSQRYRFRCHRPCRLRGSA